MNLPPQPAGYFWMMPAMEHPKGKLYPENTYVTMAESYKQMSVLFIHFFICPRYNRIAGRAVTGAPG